MKKTKLFATLTVVCLIASALSGCGGKKEKTVASDIDVTKLGDVNGLELPIVEDDTEISFLMNTSQANLEKKFFLQKVKEITGISIEPV